MVLLRLITLRTGLLLLIAEEANGLRLDSYRTVESRLGTATRNAPAQKPTEAFALRRFATVGDMATALEGDLAQR